MEREHWLRYWGGVLIPGTLVVSRALFKDPMYLPSDTQKRPNLTLKSVDKPSFCDDSARVALGCRHGQGRDLNLMGGPRESQAVSLCPT